MILTSVQAIKDFRDMDGVFVSSGQYLGELHKGGVLDKGQAWWTQKDGKVTSCFCGAFSDFVTPAKVDEMERNQ